MSVEDFDEDEALAQEAAWIGRVNDHMDFSTSRLLVYGYILREIVREMAQTKDDPQKFVADMHARVSGLVDRIPVREGDKVGPEARTITDKFFSKVSRFPL